MVGFHLLRALHGESLLQSKQSPPLTSLYQHCKPETDCLSCCKKRADPSIIKEPAPAPPEASLPIWQMTHRWLLERACLGTNQFPKSCSFKATATIFEVLFMDAAHVEELCQATRVRHSSPEPAAGGFHTWSPMAGSRVRVLLWRLSLIHPDLCSGQAGAV